MPTPFLLLRMSPLCSHPQIILQEVSDTQLFAVRSIPASVVIPVYSLLAYNQFIFQFYPIGLFQYGLHPVVYYTYGTLPVDKLGIQLTGYQPKWSLELMISRQNEYQTMWMVDWLGVDHMGIDQQGSRLIGQQTKQQFTMEF